MEGKSWDQQLRSWGRRAAQLFVAAIRQGSSFDRAFWALSVKVGVQLKRNLILAETIVGSSFTFALMGITPPSNPSAFTDSQSCFVSGLAAPRW
jgi:hypothetical protein